MDSQGQSSEWPYRAVLSGDEIGLVGPFYMDMPMYKAKFQPLPAFSKWEELFSSSLRLLREHHLKQHREQMEDIFDHHFMILTSSGEMVYKRTPRKIIAEEIAFVHIEPPLLWFRILHKHPTDNRNG